IGKVDDHATTPHTGVEPNDSSQSLAGPLPRRCGKSAQRVCSWFALEHASSREKSGLPRMLKFSRDKIKSAHIRAARVGSDWAGPKRMALGDKFWRGWVQDRV